LLTLLTMSAAAHAQTTLADYMTRIQQVGPDRIIQHCAEHSPTTRDALASEQQSFRAKLAEAAAPLLAEHPQPLPANEQFELDGFVTHLGRQQLAKAQQLDLEVYCKGLLKSLSATTVEKLRHSMNWAYARYVELAQGKAGSSGGR